MIFKNIVFIILLMLQLNASTDELFKDMNKYLMMAKEYSIQGKNILIEQTLINGINNSVDTTKIKVHTAKINNTNNHIHLDLFLAGEDKNLLIDITKFQWGVSQDKKYIIFEDIDLNMNIEWLNYLFKAFIERENGYIKVRNTPALFSLLYSMKADIPTTYKFVEKKPFTLTAYPFDEKYIKIEHLEINKENILSTLWLKDSKDNLDINIKSYTIMIENKKQTIYLKDLQFERCSKPWIQSLVEQHNIEIPLEYNDKIFKMLHSPLASDLEVFKNKIVEFLQ